MNDPSQSAFYIPYAPQDDNENAYVDAYRIAWDKCLAHLSSEIDSLYRPTVASVIRSIATAYDNYILPGLPYPELPTIAVHNASPLFINTVLEHLPDNVVTSSLFPADITTLIAGMKNLISGFLDDSRPAKSRLAAYDIGLLEEIYAVGDPLVVILHDFEQIDVGVMQDMLHICSTKIPTLSFVFLIFLNSPPTPSFIHNTYSRNTLCRLRIQPFSSLPLDSNRLLEHLLLKTFFNPAFAPDLVIGPTVLEAIADFFLRHYSSIDTLLTTLQLAYLKHFLVEPLSILNNPPITLTTSKTYDPVFSSLSSRLNLPSSSKTTLLSHLDRHRSTFFQNYQHFRLGFTLLMEVYTFLVKKGYKPIRHWEVQGITKTVINALRGQIARDIKTLSMYVRKLRQEPFRELVLSLNAIFLSLPGEVQESQGEAMDFVGGFVREVDLEDEEEEEEGEMGEFGDWLMQYLMDLLQPLDRSPLWDLWYTGSTPFPTELLNPSIRASVVNGLLHPYDFTVPIPIDTMDTIIDEDEEDGDGDGVRDGTLSPTVSEIQARLESTHVAATSPFKSNSNDATVNLLEEDTTTTTTTDMKAIHELPDTSILFSRYMNGAGKLINVYDWFQSFKSVLEIQRGEEEEEIRRRVEREVEDEKKRKGGKKGGKGIRKRKTKTKTKTRASPMKKGNGNGKRMVFEEDKEDEEEEEEAKEQQLITMIDDESYQQEIQARFIRSLHELDYLGFLKHTGRRKEHVLRTVFDVVDDDDDEEEGEGEEEMVDCEGGSEGGLGTSGDDSDDVGEDCEDDGFGGEEDEEEG